MDLPYLPNLTGQLLAIKLNVWAFNQLGDPSAVRAEDSIPWFFRLSPLYILASALFWGLIGLLLWSLARGLRPQPRRGIASRGER